MNPEDFLQSGFKEFKPNLQLDRWTRGFQKRVTDKVGIKYHVNALWWDFSRYGEANSFCYKIVFNKGCPEASLGEFAVSIEAWGSDAEQWTPEQVLQWAEFVWERLKPAYYETY